jgi:N utilization substance protein B
MSARSKARRRAVDVLYESDLRQVGARDVLAERLSLPDRPVHPYTIELVEGVVDHLAGIDEVLAGYSQGWSLERMAPVDRNILRIGVWELLGSPHGSAGSDGSGGPDVPPAVAISEAVTLAGELGGEESPGFVNGILARVLAVRPELSAGGRA